jgi:hypothetical protein
MGSNSKVGNNELLYLLLIVYIIFLLFENKHSIVNPILYNLDIGSIIKYLNKNTLTFFAQE